jgi:mono/diheme cytochrome c family protein
MRSVSTRVKPWLVVGVALLGVGAAGAWMLLPPGALSFAGGPTVSITAYRDPSPAGVPAELRAADLITRGKYLTEAADCEVCHTIEGGRRFAGGRAFATPFGVLYSPNITADRETGIGAWSDADFVTAVHKGIGRSGQRLYPAFPYESYTLLDDEDVRAIKAYLFSLPVARATAPPNSLKFPFDQRWLMGFWSAFYNPDHRFRPLERRSPEWNRGAYLAEALGHCGDCHTPRNLAQALDNRRKFAGTFIDGWRAYNITSDRRSGVGAFSDADLSAYLSLGHADGRGTASGPMGEVVHQSLSHLVPSDISALVSYLRSIPAMSSSNLPLPKLTPASALARQGPVAAADRPGKAVFEQACASCHSWSGIGLLTPFATLTGSRAVNDPTATNVAQIILSGTQRQTTAGNVFMPAFGEAYSDVEIADVANYVTGRFGTAPSAITAKTVAKLRGL